MSGTPGTNTLEGRLVALNNRTDTAGVPVWFAYTTVGGEARTIETTSDDDGSFTFELLSEPAAQARVGVNVEGATPVDLEPDGAVLEAGEVVIVIDDAVPSHLRFAGP